MNKGSAARLEAKVRVQRMTSKSGAELLGFAELVIDDAYVIKDIRIMKSKNGGGEPFMSFPARRGTGDAKDQWFDVAHPITAEARDAAKAAILAAYRQAAAKG